MRCKNMKIRFIIILASFFLGIYIISGGYGYWTKNLGAHITITTAENLGEEKPSDIANGSVNEGGELSTEEISRNVTEIVNEINTSSVNDVDNILTDTFKDKQPLESTAAAIESDKDNINKSVDIQEDNKEITQQSTGNTDSSSDQKIHEEGDALDTNIPSDK
jgi:hypothetical protein